MIDGKFGNVSAGVFFFRKSLINENGGNSTKKEIWVTRNVYDVMYICGCR